MFIINSIGSGGNIPNDTIFCIVFLLSLPLLAIYVDKKLKKKENKNV